MSGLSYKPALNNANNSSMKNRRSSVGSGGLALSPEEKRIVTMSNDGTISEPQAMIQSSVSSFQQVMNGDNIRPVNVKLPVVGTSTGYNNSIANFLNPVPAFTAIGKAAVDGSTVLGNSIVSVGQVAVMPVGSVINLFSLSEEQLRELVKESYNYMQGEEILENFIELSKRIIFIFNNFGFINLRKMMSIRMYQIVIFIGSPSQGLLYNARLMKKFLDPRTLQPLENAFSAGIKLFERFMEPFFMQNILFGRDAEKWFIDFETLTYEAVVNLGKRYDAYSYFSMPSSFPAYKVPCDVYPRALAALDGDYDALALLAAEIGTSIEELRSKLQETNLVLQALEVEINHNLTYQPAHVIQQTAFRDFIIRQFPNMQQFSTQDLKRQLPVELIENHECDERTAGALTTGLVDILNSSARTDRALLKLDEEGLFDLVELSKLTRHVPATLKNLTDVIKLIMVTASKEVFRIMPPAPAEELFWDEGQMEQMVRSLNTVLGFYVINGPALSGKSARVLALCHKLPVDRDCVWIDLFKTTNDMEMISRVCSQVHLKECVGKPDFIKEFRSFLTSLNKKSVIVIDNLDGEDGMESKVVVECFNSMLLPILNDYASKLCIVLISRLAFKMSPYKATQRLDIGPLDKIARFEMATVSCPEDPLAMVAISEGLAGSISVLKRRCSLETIRIIASEMTNPLFDNISVVIQEALANDMTSDERLCAACLIKNITPFNESMAWCMCKSAFNDNIVRWYFAWKILIKKRWVLTVGDLGYIVPADAVVAGVITTTITQDAQWDKYILFWAERLAQVDIAATVCLTALEDFDNYRSHYKNVFYGFFNKALDVGSHAKICSDMTKVACALSGNISTVLTNRFGADGGVLLAHAIYSCYDIGLRGTIFHLRGASDLGVQMRRSGQYADGIEIMNTAILDANFMPTDILEFNIEKARAYAVKGALLHSANDYFEANVYYTKAIDLWDELGLTADKWRDNFITQGRRDHLSWQIKNGCRCTIM